MPIKTNSGKQIVVGEDLESSIVRGETGGAAGQVDGYVGVSAQTTVAVKATPYTEPSSAGQRSLVSTSANDAAAGTGARTVRVYYYDNDMLAPLFEDVTLNGTTAVNTVATNIRFVDKIVVLTAGANGVNAGSIFLRELTGGSGFNIGSIAAGDNVTFWAHKYVAAGRKMLVASIITGLVGPTGTRTTCRQYKPLTSESIATPIAHTFRTLASMSTQLYHLEVPILVEGPARFELWTRPEANTAGTVWGGFGYYEVLDG